MKTFEWYPTESNETDHICELFFGEYSTASEAIIPIADKLVLNAEWGIRGTEYEIGEILKPVPTGVDLVYFSYTDAKFYKLNTPFEDLSEYFEKGLFNDYSQSSEIIENVNLGFGPGGLVNLWLMSTNQSKFISSFQAQETTVAWEDFDEDGFTKEEFISTFSKQVLKGVPHKRSSSELTLCNESFPLKLEMVSKGVVEKLDVKYCNAEKLQYSMKNNVVEIPEGRLPLRTDFTLKSEVMSLLVQVTFDERELSQIIKDLKLAYDIRLYFNVHNNDLSIEVISTDIKHAVSNFEVRLVQL